MSNNHRDQLFLRSVLWGLFATTLLTACPFRGVETNILRTDRTIDLFQDDTEPSDPATQLSFLNLPVSIPAGECLMVTAQALDETGEPAPVPLNQQVLLQINSQTTGNPVFNDPNCLVTNTDQTLLLESGFSEADFFVRFTVAEPAALLTLSSNDYSAVSQSMAVDLSGETAFVINGPPSGPDFLAGTCIGPFHINVQDHLGNPVTAPADQELDVNGLSLAGMLFEDAVCSSNISNVPLSSGNDTSSMFYVRDTLVGLTSIYAESSSAYAYTLNITPGNPTQIAVLGDLNTHVAACTPISFLLQDSYGNISPAQTDELITLSPVSHLFSDSGCSESLPSSITVPIANSTITFFFLNNIPDATYTYGFTPENLSIAPGLFTVLNQSNPPTQLRSNVTGSQEISLTACTRVDLETLDQFNLPAIPSESLEIRLSKNIAHGNFYTDSNCTNTVTDSILTLTPPEHETHFFFSLDGTLESEAHVHITTSTPDLSPAAVSFQPNQIILRNQTFVYNVEFVDCHGDVEHCRGSVYEKGNRISPTNPNARWELSWGHYNGLLWGDTNDIHYFVPNAQEPHGGHGCKTFSKELLFDFSPDWLVYKDSGTQQNALPDILAHIQQSYPTYNNVDSVTVIQEQELDGTNGTADTSMDYLGDNCGSFPDIEYQVDIVISK